MNSSEALDFAREAVWLVLQMSGPIMIVGLAVGVGIALLQALTQVQEMTLVFVPKIVAIFLALLVFMSSMGALLGDFMTRIADSVAAM
jgi:flagellar biosynthetic protein FliQ